MPELVQSPQRPRLTRPAGQTHDERMAHVRAHYAAVQTWELALLEWERQMPRTERLIFDAGSVVRIVTPSILYPPGWRVTSFSVPDRMPLGHMEWASRFKALIEALYDAPTRIPKIPFEVQPLLRRRSFP